MGDLYVRQSTNDTISERADAKAVFNSSHPPDEVRYEEYHYDHKAAYYFFSSHIPLVFLPVQIRACGVVLELEVDVRHKVDADGAGVGHYQKDRPTDDRVVSPSGIE